MQDYRNVLFKACFEFEHVSSPLLKKVMKEELIRVYNIYARTVNESGIFKALNREFDKLYPDFVFDPDYIDEDEYTHYISEKLNEYVIDRMNKKRISWFMTFWVDPKELAFKGRLRWYKKATIDFWMEEVVKELAD